MNTIDSIIETLANTQTSPDALNMYAPDDVQNTARRDNLRRYLQAMHERQPSALMVMEAPGYRGCRLTGIPVTSRKIVREGVPELDLFGESRGYATTTDAGFERIDGEQSATIVWGTLAELRRAPLIWNTFPFHPHKPDHPLTNRRPRKPEMAQGVPFIQAIIALFQPQTIIAVGNVAYETLTGAGYDCVKVRHPAQGGKNDFVAGMTEQLG